MMMTEVYKDYVIEIYEDPTFAPGSADNVRNYEMVYADGRAEILLAKIGVSARKNGEVVSSAILCEPGAPVRVHENSVIIVDDHLLVCCSDKVFSLNLPTLTLNWKMKMDLATCLGIHSFKDDVIVHGELEIKRLDFDGNVKWNFSAKDIFVTQDGSKALTIAGNRIKVVDWDGDIYVLDENGVTVSN